MRKTRKLWGGRFSTRTDPVIERYTASLRFDWRLAPYDIQASIAHARMLAKQGLVSREHGRRIVSGLQRLARQWSGMHPACAGAEDIHSWIQGQLEERIGSAARLLQTGRSRNDQVVTAVKLYCRDHGHAMVRELVGLARQLISVAEAHLNVVIPGYTHLQRAQPVLLAHHLLAYVEMLERDQTRLADWLDRMNVLPAGAGALGGIGLPIDQRWVAKTLGFREITANSLDAVSDRDFQVELVSDLAIVMTHLSRLAEDLILWSTAEFGFVQLDEAVMTGSSLMPQKRNPDALELIRGGAAKVAADLTGLLALQKGLPLGYQRDLQRDKEFLFEAVELVQASLEAMTRCLKGLRVRRERLEMVLRDPGLYATDLADYLVKKGVPFAQAHETVGRLLQHGEQEGIELRVAAMDLFHRFDPHFGQDVYQLFRPLGSVSLKKTVGGTAPEQVSRSLSHAKARLAYSVQRTAFSGQRSADSVQDKR